MRRRGIVVFALVAACGGGDAGDDVGGDGAGVPDAAAGGGGAVVYAADRTQSPMTPSLAAALRAIPAGDARADVLAKVGDSITVSTWYLGCLAAPAASLPTELEPTRAFYAAGDVGGTTPFDRESLAAGIGWSAPRALSGDPAPIDAELAAIHPRVATIMYGTNDVEGGDLDVYYGALAELVDRTLAAGAIPILSTIPPRLWNANDPRVPGYNLIVRALAQGRGLPLVDFWREAAVLPGYGLGPDGLHPDATGAGCDFSADGLAHGQNTRNLITLTALDRLRAALDDAPAPDDDDAVARLHGAGTVADPIAGALPLVDVADTAVATSRALDGYACSPGSNEAGAERVYTFTLDAPARVTATVVDRGDTDVDVHILDGALDAAACVARDDRTAAADLGAGTHYVVVDTYVAGGVERAGEFAVTIAPD